MTATELAKILDEVAALIKAGWLQKKYCNNRGCYCLMGAIYRVVRSRGLVTTEERKETVPQLLRGALAMVTGTLDLEVWNDETGRTQAEVVEAVEETARRLRNGREQQGA